MSATLVSILLSFLCDRLGPLAGPIVYWLLGVVTIARVFPSMIMVPYVSVNCRVAFLWLVRTVVVDSLASWVTLLGRGAKTNLFTGRSAPLVRSRLVVVPRLLVLSMVSFVKLGRSARISAWALVVWVVSRVAQFSFGFSRRMAVPRCRTWGTSLGVTFFLVLVL